MVDQTVLPAMSFDLPRIYNTPPPPPFECFYHNLRPPQLKGTVIISTELSTFKDVRNFRATLWELWGKHSLQPSIYPKVALSASEAINNALRSAPSTPCEIEIYLDRDLSLLSVDIADHGPGMPPNKASEMLTPLCSGYESFGLGFTCMFGECGIMEIYSITQGTENGLTVRLHILI